MKTILVVDDERQIAHIARDYLQRAGYSVITRGDGIEALALAREHHPDLVVLDLGATGRASLRKSCREASSASTRARAREAPVSA